MRISDWSSDVCSSDLVLRGSARSAVTEATVILTNPTHFAVALRYRPGVDAAPIVVARGRGATAQAIREPAGEEAVPVLSYPQLARAIYFTARTGQVIRDALYLAVATVRITTAPCRARVWQYDEFSGGP